MAEIWPLTTSRKALPLQVERVPVFLLLKRAAFLHVVRNHKYMHVSYLHSCRPQLSWISWSSESFESHYLCVFYSLLSLFNLLVYFPTVTLCAHALTMATIQFACSIYLQETLAIECLGCLEAWHHWPWWNACSLQSYSNGLCYLLLSADAPKPAFQALLNGLHLLPSSVHSCTLLHNLLKMLNVDSKCYELSYALKYSASHLKC